MKNPLLGVRNPQSKKPQAFVLAWDSRKALLWHALYGASSPMLRLIIKLLLITKTDANITRPIVEEIYSSSTVHNNGYSLAFAIFIAFSDFMVAISYG